MKKVFIPLVAALLTMFAVSCNKDSGDDMIWDLNPIMFHIQVLNENGVDMLTPTSPGYDKTFVTKSSITLQGRDYKMGQRTDTIVNPSSRAYYENFHGMGLTEYKGQYFVAVGPFMADYTWRHEKIKFNWGDGSTDEIDFSSSVHWTGANGAPNFDRLYLFNGQDSTNVLESRGYIVVKKQAGK